jgi:hypothetical protein
LERRFGVPHNPYSQDWEYEAVDPARFGEYLAAYRSGELDDDERFTVMMMLVQCVEEMRRPDPGTAPEWRVVAELLRSEPRLHASTIHHWACLDETDLEDCFRLSGPMRRIWADVQREIV